MAQRRAVEPHRPDVEPGDGHHHPPAPVRRVHADVAQAGHGVHRRRRCPRPPTPAPTPAHAGAHARDRMRGSGPFALGRCRGVTVVGAVVTSTRPLRGSELVHVPQCSVGTRGGRTAMVEPTSR